MNHIANDENRSLGTALLLGYSSASIKRAPGACFYLSLARPFAAVLAEIESGPKLSPSAASGSTPPFASRRQCSIPVRSKCSCENMYSLF